MQQRIRRQPFLELFDGADANAETGMRPLTTTALQALYTMNDPFFHAQADAHGGACGHEFRFGRGAVGLRLQAALRARAAPDEIREDAPVSDRAREIAGRYGDAGVAAQSRRFGRA